MEIVNLFDLFGSEETVEEVKTEVKAELKKKAEPKAKVEDVNDAEETSLEEIGSDIINDDEDDIEEDVTTGDDESKADEKKKKTSAPKKAAKAKSSKSIKVKGPVRVIGLGWVFEYGEDGKEYTPLACLKAAYNAGYKEVAFKDAVITTDGVSALFVSIFDNPSIAHRYAETDCIGGKISVEVGMNKAEYETKDFGEDVSESEISAFDLAQKYLETHPDFKGFSLAVDRSIKVAAPYYVKSSETSVTLDADSDIVIYKDGGNITSHITTDEEFRKELVDGYGEGTKVSLYKSETDVVFVTYKGKQSVSVKPEGIVGETYKKAENKTIEEVYRLPFVLVLPNLGIHKEMQADDFGGKSKIKKSDVVDFLKGQYSIFKSPNRQVIIDYEKPHGIVSVMVAAGKKG